MVKIANFKVARQQFFLHKIVISKNVNPISRPELFKTQL